jgi:hypothetical protein
MLFSLVFTGQYFAHQLVGPQASMVINLFEKAPTNDGGLKSWLNGMLAKSTSKNGPSCPRTGDYCERVSRSHRRIVLLDLDRQHLVSHEF